MITLPVERHSPMPPAPPSLDPHDPTHGTVEVRLAALADAVPAARRFVTDRAARWRLSELAADCELVVAEIVTNAVVETGSLRIPATYTELHDHTPAVIIVRMRLTAKRIFAEVWDRSDSPPVPASAGEEEENGRGLLLVEAFTTDWSWYRSAARPGKVVWACWDLPPSSAPPEIPTATRR